jgi:predicted nucleic acid-binding protein
VPFYLDASALVAIIALEPTHVVVRAVIAADRDVPIVSDFARAEASAALMRLVSIRNLARSEVPVVLKRLDDWALTVAEARKTNGEDIEAATAFVRRPELTLRAPAAIHIAAAHRLGATLLTLDRGLARAAATLGVPCINPAEADAPGAPKD